MNSQSAIAAAAASKAKRGIRPTLPGTFSVFNPATIGSQWTLDDTRRIASQTQAPGSLDQSALATIARGTGGGVWQCEFIMGPDYVGGQNLLVGIGKAGRYSTGAVGQDSTLPTSDDGYAVFDVNGSTYHAGGGAAGLTASWVPGTVIGFILDCSNPANYILSVYKDGGAPVKVWSTQIGSGAVNNTSDFAGDYYPAIGQTFVGSLSLSVIINSGQEAFRRFVSGAAPWGS